MQVRKLLVVFAMILHASPILAQRGGAAAPSRSAASRSAPPEAARFNFLIGQWDLKIEPVASGLGQRIHGAPRLAGVWKAWRALDGWGIEDELRVTDASGNPLSFSHSVRHYNATTKSWQSSSLDVYRGLFTLATAQWRNNEMVTSFRGTAAEAKPYISRGRFIDIRGNAFRFVQERSFDNGKTWKENLTMEAKRVAAAASR